MHWIVVLTFVAGWERSTPLQAPHQPQTFFTSPLPIEQMRGKQVVIETSMGTIVIDLLSDAAPNHVALFITRAKEGAYGGTIFHRVIAMGIIQGGDPLSRDPAQREKYGRAVLACCGSRPMERSTHGGLSLRSWCLESSTVPGRSFSSV
jgi:Cyclophilin type peptidyl-prolyl cis-trans isomerase/CLD